MKSMGMPWDERNDRVNESINRQKIIEPLINRSRFLSIPFIQSVIHSILRSFLFHSLIHSISVDSICPIMPYFRHCFLPSFVHSCIPSFIHSIIPPLIVSFAVVASSYSVMRANFLERICDVAPLLARCFWFYDDALTLGNLFRCEMKTLSARET